MDTTLFASLKSELLYLKSLLFKDKDAYRRDLRANGRAFWNGTWEYLDFYIAMQDSIKRYFTQAFTEGAASCGVRIEELTDTEKARLASEINAEQGRILGLVDFIEANKRENGGAWETVSARLELWANAYDRIRTLAQSLACGDVKLKWVWNPRKEHCSDCRKLNGRIYRASIWAKYDVRPQHWNLACRGLRCGCRFEETDERATPGYPPRLSNDKEHSHEGEQVITT